MLPDWLVLGSSVVPAPNPQFPLRDGTWPSASNRQSVTSAVLTLIHKLQHQQRPYLRVHRQKI